MTTNHDDNGDFTPMPGNDPLDTLLREWHAENAGRAAAQRDKLMQAVAANAKSRLREQLEYAAPAARHNSSSPTEAGRYALSLKKEGAKARPFARFAPAIAASLAFAATLGLLFSTVGPRAAEARADFLMAPDGGRLDAVNAKGELIGPCPLQHTDVHVDVSGSFARVTLKQRYGNPYADKIEAVYTFPLSHRAAVDRMTMTLGNRVVVGEVKEREAARAVYQAARDAGHAAALLEQERHNIFTQSVANIEPGVEIVVEISYVELLEARDGVFGFAFPMVVAPRYIPGGDDSGKAIPTGLQHRNGVNLLAPAALTITANGDISQIGAIPPEVIQALITDAAPIEEPSAEWWTSRHPTGQAPFWHQFTAAYADGLVEAGVLYPDGIGHINGRWFYIDAGGQAWPPTAAAMPPGASTPSTGFSSGTAQVPDAARITPQPVKPTTRAGHDISITVNIDTGGPGITDLTSELHAIQQNWGGMRTDGTLSQVAVSLNDAATIPNQDFVLHWRQTADTITEQVFTHAGPRGNFLTLILNPPARVENQQAVPRELVFVLDTSGSMQGFPIQKAKEVMSKAIAALRPQDTFNLITFAGDTNILWDTPQPASPDKLAEAQQFLDSREGRGGTEMMNAINAALTVKPESRQLALGEAAPVRIVCFMTDGEVGNDMQIIDAVKNNAATSRVFSFGIGNSVNRYLLDGIARAGRGAAEYVLLSEGADEKVASFSQRIQSPVLMDVQMEFSGDIEIVDGVCNGVDSMVDTGNSSSPTEGGRYALRLPDLYDVAPVIVHARYTKGGKGSVTLRGNAGDGFYEKTIKLDLPEAQAEHNVIATLWAREKVEQIMNRDLAAAQNSTFPDDLKKQVIDLGETFQIMTQYTSFVAVENLRVTIGGQPRLVPVPIEMPEGQSWEGTMGEAVNKFAETIDMWQLVRANNTTPKQFNCPSQTDTPDPAQDTTAYYDFLTEVNLSYSYQYQADPNSPPLGTGSDPTFPLMADANPYINQASNYETYDVIASKLQQLTGEIHLDGVSFEQTINQLRDLSGVNIAVDWKALETAAIEKDREVSLHLAAGTVTYETALKLLLEETGGGEVEIGSKASDGVLSISLKESLEPRTTVQVYNVEDLIKRVSEIESAVQEDDLKWQRTELDYRKNEEQIKKAVIDYNFAEARQLMDQSQQSIEANSQYAADTARYEQFRDRAVQLRFYIDAEETAFNNSSLADATVEADVRERQRVLMIDESKREQIDQLMSQAVELRKERRYDDAAAVLEQTLAIDPDNQRAATMKETLEDISAHVRERQAKSSQQSAPQDLLVEAEEALTPWQKDALYPKNWGEISAKREPDIAPSSTSTFIPVENLTASEAKQLLDGLEAGQPDRGEVANARRRGNTNATNREGAEVLFVDGHVDFKKKAEAGMLLYGRKKQPFNPPQNKIVNSYDPSGAIGGPKSSYWFDTRPTAGESRVAGQAGRPPSPECLGREVRLGEIGKAVAQAPAEEQTRAGIANNQYGIAHNESAAGETRLRAGFVINTPALTPTADKRTATLGEPLQTVDADALRRSVLAELQAPVAPRPMINYSRGRTPPAAPQEAYDAPTADVLASVSLGVPVTQTGSGGEHNVNLIDRVKELPLNVATASEWWRASIANDIPLYDTNSTTETQIPTMPDTGGAAGATAYDGYSSAPGSGWSTVTIEAELEKKNKELHDFRASWSVLGQGVEPNEKLMTLESVVTELELDALGKEALWEQVKNSTPKQAPSEQNQQSTSAGIAQAQQDYLRAEESLKRANDQLTRVKAEQRDKDAKMAEYQKLVNERDALSARLGQWAGTTHHTNRAGQNVRFKNGHIDFDENPAALVNIKRNSPSTRMLIDQLIVRAASLAKSGRLDSALAVVDAILKGRPVPSTAGNKSHDCFAAASEMHDVLTCFVLTRESCAARVCELAAGAAGRLSATAERARTLAKRLDERLLRVVLGEAAIVRTHHVEDPPRRAGGGPAEAALADPGAPGPVAPGATDGLDITDDGVLVSVLIDAFGDGTVADLVQAGLTVESTFKSTRVVIGRIAGKRLPDLATSKHVRRVEAVRVN